MNKIIHNADHLEFEIEHANTRPKDRPDWPLPSFDARDWAKAFCRRFMVMDRAGYDTKPVDDDEGLMIAWFANALMRGYDEHAARSASPEPSKDGAGEEVPNSRVNAIAKQRFPSSEGGVPPREC